MTEPACACDGPGDCPRYGPVAGWQWSKCRGVGCTPAESEAWRDHLAARKARRLVPIALDRVTVKPGRVPLRPACVHQGEVVPGCKTCGGEGSIIRWCESPDDDADRCVRGRSRDKTVRSCLDCEHYAPPPGP